ncbi:MAG: ribokinase [Candidatus Micrarchaeota archaeon]|nr:ribokinase [Candidatus Micrarchaeota archaeon]
MNMDIVIVADRLPDLGEYLYGSQLHFVPGGNGLNQAVAAARLGGKVSLTGFVGQDAFGRVLTNFAKSEDVETKDVRIIENTHSSTVIYLLTGTAERHIVFTGSSMKASIKDLPDLQFSSSDIVISQLAIPQDVIYHAFEKAKAAGAKTLLNLFPNYEVSKELLGMCDYLVLNEVELAFRSGHKEYVSMQHKDLRMDPSTVMRHVKEMRTSGSQTVITTLADRGVIGIRDNEMTSVNGIKVDLVDATGAGDCFIGAFAAGLAEKRSFKESLEFANCAAAISVQKVGASVSYPDRNEVDALMKEQYI